MSSKRFVVWRVNNIGGLQTKLDAVNEAVKALKPQTRQRVFVLEVKGVVERDGTKIKLRKFE